jgi:MarR-like DNA-binding transcriptional regulator SgrR of sgrS sRNA
MHSKFIAIIFIISLTLLSCSSSNKSFSILMQELPDRINPYDAGIDYKLYVLKQLFEPLFVYKSDYTYHSNLLSSWSSKDNHQVYDLCLKPDVRFSNNNKLTIVALKANLLRLQKKGILSKNIYSLETSNSCLSVKFNEPYIRFPFDLSSYMSSVVDPDTAEKNIVVGVSEYYVKKITPKVIQLSTNNKTLTYSEVLFYKWAEDNNETNSLYKLDEIDDFNQLPIEFVPEKVKELNVYEVPALSTVVMLINTKDKKVREIVYNCLDYKELRRIFTPKRDDFSDVGGLLPSGIIGAIQQPISQKCNFEKLNKRINLRYIEAMRPKSIPVLQQYVDEKLLKYNIKVNVEYKDINALAEVLLSDKKEYDLTIVGMNSYIPDPYGYYQCFYGDHLLMTNVSNAELIDSMQKYVAADTLERKKEFSMKANRSLLSNYQFIPLYQESRRFYFANDIKNVSSDPLFLNYLKISEL